MATRIETVWADSRRLAEIHPLQTGSMKLVHLAPGKPVDLYAGLDEKLRPLLALRLSKRPPQIRLESDALQQFRVQRTDGAWQMVLRLERRGLEPVFGRLCQDLVDAATDMTSESRLLDLFVSRLKLWERLFSYTNDGLLSSGQIRGLMAELLVLQRLLQAGKRSAMDVVGGWVGPTGADQDFVYDDLALEVKSLVPGRVTVSISSLGQLDCAVPLRLVVVPLASASGSAPGAVSLNGVVARIEMLVSSDGAALDLLRSRLLEARYVDHPDYDDQHFVPEEPACFSVGPGFPRLLRGEMSPGVVEAQYQLGLSALQPFQTPASLE